MDILVRPAKSSDIDAVARIAGERDLDLAAKDEAESRGFLVSRFSKDDYRELLERADAFYVAVSDGDVVGFVVAYGRDRVSPDEAINVELGAYYDDFTVIKQVATSAERTGEGVGTKLYQRVLDRRPDIPVVASLVSDPENRASMALHRNMGFRPMLSLQSPDGLPRTVWVRVPDNAAMLKEQLRLATDLYKHEDLLNWQKLGSFLYVTVGLVALCSVTLSVATPKATAVILSISGALGAFISLAFFVTLRAGVVYLHQRKDALAQLETRFVRPGGVRVSAEASHGKPQGHLARSPTATVLRALPLLAAGVWACLAVISLAYLLANA